MSRALRSLLDSFRAAWNGIRGCVRHERNMRIHLAVALGVTLLSLFYRFTAVEYALLALVFGVMIAAEMFNTAIERVVDMSSPGYSHLAKLSKDIAAGAVLTCAVSAVAVGLLLFSRPEGVADILLFFGGHKLECAAALLTYLAFALCFIFLPGRATRPPPKS